MNIQNISIAVIGLGYVGLPLAVEFGKKYTTIGFDINQNRVDELIRGTDSTFECSSQELASSENLKFCSVVNDIKYANFYVITVPTPIDKHNQPDMTPLEKASEMVGRVISKGDIIVYESTVYPGATEEVCLPIVEKVSGLKLNSDFYAGYSPERINPGDKQHRLPDILKVTSGSTESVADYVDEVYNSIITAGTYKASSIRVAEAAKVIENTQRDVNIALVNELSIIFNKLGIDTLEVLEAAGTKWNFLPFRPGLVGGHCIGVDPYYLTHKAQSVGYHPEMILAGRRINNGMGRHVVSQLIKKMIKKQIPVDGAKVLILGFSFKENCPDVRNTRVVDMILELNDYNLEPDIVDPWCSDKEVYAEYGKNLISEPLSAHYDAIIIAVAHDQFKKMDVEIIRSFGKANHVLYDLKFVLPKEESDLRL